MVSSLRRSLLWSWPANLLVPGAGLILCRREWLGVTVAAVFGLCGNVALAGWWIAPAAIPVWLTWVAGTLAGGTWVLAQYLLRQRLLQWRRQLAAVQPFLEEAAGHLAGGRAEAAARALDSIAEADDENAELYVLRARTAQLHGDKEAGCAAWREVLRYSLDESHRAEARRELGAQTDKPTRPAT